MASNSEANDYSDQLFDAETDDILASFELEIEKIVPAKAQQKFPCDVCDKVCLSKGGLTRHTRTIHKQETRETENTDGATDIPHRKKVEDILHPGVFKKMVVECIKKIIKENCFPEDVLMELQNFSETVSGIDDVMPCYNLVKDIVLKFNGNAEKFYPSFCKVFNTSPGPFQGLGYHCTVLLGMELSNCVLAHLTGAKRSPMHDGDVVIDHTSQFNERQMSIISYLSGYVIGTYYRRLRFRCNKSQESDYISDCLDFLSSCKLDESKETDTSHQKLVNVKNRGGLWKVKIDVIRIFCIAEQYFLSATKDFTLTIDATKLVGLMMEDAFLLSYFGSIRTNCERKVNKEITMNLLEDMLTLYIRVRSHSYANDMKQKHKISKAKVKSRSLRTEIKKSTNSLESGH